VLKPHQALPEPEELFLDYAQRLAHHRAGRKALFLALSALAPTPHPDEHWHVVENLLAPVVRRRGGEIFRFRNGDAAAILRSADRELVERLTLKLRYLFRDDPLVSREETADLDLLCKWFDLGEEYDALLALARDIEARLHKTQSALPIPGEPSETPLPVPGGQEFRGPSDPQQSPLIRWLTAPPSAPRAMDRLARMNPVARLGADGAPTAAFELIEAQAEALLPIGFPERDLERNPQLVAALRGLAARRLLIELPSARQPADPLALILPVETLLGTELLALERHWAAARGAPITFLLSQEERLADPLRYRYLRQMLKSFGHRLGLHGMPLESLGEPVDADLLSFAWLPAYGDGTDLPRATPAGSRADLLITEIHTRDALSFARKFGAGLIAGRQAGRASGKT
jgi:hypothetical protein